MFQNFCLSVMEALKYGVANYKDGKLKPFAEHLHIRQQTMYRWLYPPVTIPNLRDIGKVMDYLGVTINCPWEHLEAIKPSPEDSKLVNDLTQMCVDIDTEIANLQNTIISLQGKKAGYESVITKIVNGSK